MEWIRQNSTKLIILMVVGVSAAALAWRTLGNDATSKLPQSFSYICAETGEVFKIPRGRTDEIPRKNPKTERMTLLRIHEIDGKKMIRERDRSALSILGDLNLYIDPKTLEIRQ